MPETEQDQRLMTCNVDELSGWLDSWLDEIGRSDLRSIEELERYAETLPVERRPVALPPAGGGS